MNLIYLSGPMSGLPDFNFPAFNELAKILRGKGYNVVNPAEIEEEPGKEWHEYLRKDIRAMMDCDTICLLPGWDKSKGARLELHIALELGFKVMAAVKTDKGPQIVEVVAFIPDQAGA